MDILLIIPAYGRRYLAEGSAWIDWSGGKDFQIAPTGPYMSIRDVERIRADGYTSIVLFRPQRDGGNITLWKA